MFQIVRSFEKNISIAIKESLYPFRKFYLLKYMKILLKVSKSHSLDLSEIIKGGFPRLFLTENLRVNPENVKNLN